MNAMILMPQILDVIANENVRYILNELESIFDEVYIYSKLVLISGLRTLNIKWYCKLTFHDISDPFDHNPIGVA